MPPKQIIINEAYFMLTLLFGPALFLIAAAVIPPLVLLGVIYKMDKAEREPPHILIPLFVQGVIAMIPILILEVLADKVVQIFSWTGLLYLFLAYFVVPGCIEEGVKFWVFLRRAWDEPNFNYRFDGVVYAVFISLGFAAVENVMYVLSSGFATAVVRALFSIPGHAMFGVVMGVGLGKAKALHNQGQTQASAAARTRAVIAAAVLHGLYDFLLMAFGWVFYLYFALLVVFTEDRSPLVILDEYSTTFVILSDRREPKDPMCLLREDPSASSG